MDREVSGVAAGSRARKRAVAPWSRWREAALVWAFDTGRSHTRLAYGDLRALDVNPGVRVLRVVRLGDCMEKPPPAGDGPICASV